VSAAGRWLGHCLRLRSVVAAHAPSEAAGREVVETKRRCGAVSVVRVLSEVSGSPVKQN
jgi:hypothetical protein